MLGARARAGKAPKGWTRPPPRRRRRRSYGRSMVKRLWERGQHGWPASYPVAQFPNAPLLIALGGWGVAALTDGSLHGYARGVFYAGLAVWGYEEVSGGANAVRRVFGAVGLAYAVVEIGRALG